MAETTPLTDAAREVREARDWAWDLLLMLVGMGIGVNSEGRPPFMTRKGMAKAVRLAKALAVLGRRHADELDAIESGLGLDYDADPSEEERG